MSAIGDKYAHLAAVDISLCTPKGPEAACANQDSLRRYYVTGRIYWKQVVTKHFGNRRDAQSGRWNQFKSGVIFSKKGAGTAYVVHGDPLAKWDSLGSYQGTLGYSASGEIPIPGRTNARQTHWTRHHYLDAHSRSTNYMTINEKCMEQTTGPLSVSRFGSTPNQFTGWCGWAATNNFLLTTAALYGDSDNLFLVAAWNLNVDNTAWNTSDVSRKEF